MGATPPKYSRPALFSAVQASIQRSLRWQTRTSYHRPTASTGFEPAHLGSTKLIYETECDSRKSNPVLWYFARIHQRMEPHMLLSLGGYARRRDTGDRLCRAKRSIRVERTADPCIAYVMRMTHPDLLIHQGCMTLIGRRRA